MARPFKLQFDMEGGNVRFSGQPLTMDLDVTSMTENNWTVMSLKLGLETLLLHRRKNGPQDSESEGLAQLDGWMLTAAAMVWHIGEQLLVGFRDLQDYLPKPLPDIATIFWTVRDAFPSSIMSHICNSSNKSGCKLGWQGERQYLWFLSAAAGIWVVFGKYSGQWSWEKWPIESTLIDHDDHNVDGMLLHNMEVVFEDLDEELQMTIVSQSILHNYQAMPDICKDNYWLAYHAAMIDGRVLQHLKPQFQKDQAIVQAAVRQHPNAIQWAAKLLQPNPDKYQ